MAIRVDRDCCCKPPRAFERSSRITPANCSTAGPTELQIQFIVVASSLKSACALSLTTTAVRATATVEATETGVATERAVPRHTSVIGCAEGPLR
jgi:hypothetical protein